MSQQVRPRCVAGCDRDPSVVLRYLIGPVGPAKFEPRSDWTRAPHRWRYQVLFFCRARDKASMGSCQVSETLTVPVTLSESSSTSDVQIVPCHVTAGGTLLELKKAVKSFLGFHDVVDSLKYRGCEASLSSQLDTFAAGASTGPRFQASFTKAISAVVRTSSGQQRYLFR